MIEMSCDSKMYSYTLKIDGSYTASASCVEDAKKKILDMIEDGMNAAINKKLDSSSAFVIDVEGNIINE